jgi:ribosome modulation factor
MKPDYWTEGYRAGLAGLTYSDNPYQEPGGTAWAFGCGEGMKERNRRAFSTIVAALRSA